MKVTIKKKKEYVRLERIYRNKYEKMSKENKEGSIRNIKQRRSCGVRKKKEI